jgi:hypothetical protein
MVGYGAQSTKGADLKGYVSCKFARFYELLLRSVRNERVTEMSCLYARPHMTPLFFLNAAQLE